MRAAWKAQGCSPRSLGQNFLQRFDVDGFSLKSIPTRLHTPVYLGSLLRLPEVKRCSPVRDKMSRADFAAMT